MFFSLCLNNDLVICNIVRTTIRVYYNISQMAMYKGAAKEGGRAQILIKKRQQEQDELEHRKRKIEEEMKIGNINNKFAAHYDAVEQKLKSDTVGKEISISIKHHMSHNTCDRTLVFKISLRVSTMT